MLFRVPCHCISACSPQCCYGVSTIPAVHKLLPYVEIVQCARWNAVDSALLQYVFTDVPSVLLAINIALAMAINYLVSMCSTTCGSVAFHIYCTLSIVLTIKITCSQYYVLSIILTIHTTHYQASADYDTEVDLPYNFGAAIVVCHTVVPYIYILYL